MKRDLGALAYAYDFEDHLVQQGGLTIVYDGDGNRVAKTTANATTKFLVDQLNPTGYAQVVDELQNNAVSRTYTWGLELISERQTINATPTTSYYVFDGHGSVRAMTDATGAVTDTYDYDAFGNLIHSTGTTPNNYLFAGEQFDPDLGLYYNRARYLNVSTGRFWTMDTIDGHDGSPAALHRYLYVNCDPVNFGDPSGHSPIASIGYGPEVHRKIGDDFEAKVPGGISDTSTKNILGIKMPGGLGRPDLTDTFNHLGYEIKPVGSETLGAVQLSGYLVLLTMFDPEGYVWLPGELYIPPTIIRMDNGRAIAFVSPPIAGVIIYEVEDLVEIVSVVTVAAGYQLGSLYASASLTAAYGVP